MKNKKQQLSISVFFPCYNDAKTIGKLVKNAHLTVSKFTKNFEVIVIDDGSADNSREVLKKLSKEHRKLKLVFHPKNRGYGAVLRTGFQTASKKLVFYTDGDGQYDVKELPLLINLMSKDANFINGIKMTRHDYTHRVVIGNLYNFVNRWLFLLPIYDVDCDFRLIRTDLVKKLDLRSTSGSICIELVKKAERAGAQFRHVSVHHYERKYGNSQFFRPKHLLKTFIELGYLWINIMIYDKAKERFNAKV